MGFNSGFKGLKLCGKISSVCSEIFLTSVDKITDTIAIPYVLPSNTYHTRETAYLQPDVS